MLNHLENTEKDEEIQQKLRTLLELIHELIAFTQIMQLVTRYKEEQFNYLSIMDKVLEIEVLLGVKDKHGRRLDK